MKFRNPTAYKYIQLAKNPDYKMSTLEMRNYKKALTQINILKKSVGPEIMARILEKDLKNPEFLKRFAGRLRNWEVLRRNYARLRKGITTL